MYVLKDWLKSKCTKGLSGDFKLDDLHTIGKSWSMATDPQCRYRRIGLKYVHSFTPTDLHVYGILQVKKITV